MPKVFVTDRALDVPLEGHEVIDRSWGPPLLRESTSFCHRPGGMGYRMIGHNGSMKRRCTDVPARLGRRCVIGVTTVAFALGGCSGDDDSSPSSSSSAETTATSATAETALTSVATTSSSTESPSATTSTAESSSVPPATVGTTRATTSTVLMSEEAVAEAARQLHRAWTDCLSHLPACDAVAVSTGHATGDLSDVIYIQASGLIEDGRRADLLDTRTITVESVQLDPAAGTATVVTCENDGSRSLASDGTVVNAAYVSRRLAYTFLSNGETWLGATRVEQQRADGEGNGLCAPTG